MNAFRNTLQRSALAGGRRFASGGAAMPKPPVPEIYQYSFKQSWLSDPSTYPLIVVMSCATAMILGMSAHALLCLKDVRISPSRKHETLQSWGSEKVPSVTSVISEGPAFYRDAFHRIHGGEGLGVDHAAWKKFKEDYNRDL